MEIHYHSTPQTKKICNLFVSHQSAPHCCWCKVLAWATVSARMLYTVNIYMRSLKWFTTRACFAGQAFTEVFNPSSKPAPQSHTASRITPINCRWLSTYIPLFFYGKTLWLHYMYSWEGAGCQDPWSLLSCKKLQQLHLWSDIPLNKRFHISNNSCKIIIEKYSDPYLGSKLMSHGLK